MLAAAGGGLNAQDLALGREARVRGLLDGERLAHAQQARRSASERLAQVLVRERLVAGMELGRLIELLRSGAFGCGRCRSGLSYDRLAALSSLACPQCGEELRFVEGVMSTGGGRSAAPAPVPEPGARLGTWQLVSLLGRGSFGVVYLARREGLQRDFAVKLLRPEVADEENVARFRLEAAAASKIEDPGVVGVFEVAQAGPFHYYAMEYCPGRTLQQRLAEEGPLPWREVARVGASLARTLAAAHAAGVIHRDLKPANVILEERSGRPRITDFGLARAADLSRSLTQTGEMLGTPLYASPEQLRGEKARDPKVDVYGLGATLYCALTGFPPHDGVSLVELAQKVHHEDPRPPETRVAGIPRPLGALCLRALRRDPAQRPSAAELADELEEFVRRSEQRPSGRAHHTAPRAPRRALMVAGAAVLLLAVGGAIGLTGPRSTPAPLAASAVPPPPPTTPAPVAPDASPPAPVGPPAPAPPEWVVAYYMPYDGALSGIGPPILAALSRGATSPRVTVAVQADFKGPGGSSRYLLGPGRTTEEAVQLPEVEASAALPTFRGWLDWLEQAVPARRVAIVLLGHGGLLDQSCRDTHPGADAVASSAWLSLPDVAAALAEFRGRARARGAEVELVFLQQAGRGQLENFHALRGAARVVMASQATIGAPNFYYEPMLERLARDDLDGAALARVIAEGDRDDMFAAYSALDGAALEELPERLDAVLRPLCGLPVLALDGPLLAHWVTYKAGSAPDDETFVDGVALLRSLVTDCGLDIGPLDRFEAWARERLVVVRHTSPTPTSMRAPRAPGWSGFSLFIPRTTAQLQRYEGRYPLLRDTLLRELWQKTLGDR